MIPALIVLAVVILLALIFFGMYNGLVRLRNDVRNAWSQIDVQLKRRHDLIPNLVQTVTGYMQHERGTLEAVTKARTAAQSATSIPDRAKAEGELSSALGKLMVVVEAYPDLKANQNFLALQEELTSTENKISFARQFYNDITAQYNTRIQVVPNNIVANIGGFQPAEFFQIADKAEREAPKVSFPQPQ